MIIHTFEQRTEEWYKIRLGKFTGSSFHALMGIGKMREKLILEKTAEHLTMYSDIELINSADIRRGVEQEDEAIFLYEVQSNVKVDHVGFIELDDFTGCSPDGLVGSDGLVEAKCPRQSVYLETVLTGKIKPEYDTQIHYDLYVSDRKWCDFVMYHRKFGIWIKRFYRDEEKIKNIVRVLEEAKAQVRNNITRFNLIKKGKIDE